MKKIVSAAAATMIATSLVAAPAAHAFDVQAYFQESVNKKVLDGSTKALSVKVDGDKCTLTDADGKKETKTRTEAEAYVKDASKVLAESLKGYETAQQDQGRTEKELKEGIDKLAEKYLELHAYRACSEGRDVSASSVKAESMLSSLEGSPSEIGYGVIAAGVVLVLGAIFAFADFVLPTLAPQLMAMLPF